MITFRRADGSYAGRRAVVGPHPCDELAEAAAVIIASWQLDPDTSERALALPAAESSTASSLATSAASGPQPAAGVGGWSFGLGIGASLSDGGAAGAAIASLERWQGAWGIGADAQASQSREAVLPGGTADWRRLSLTAAPRLRVPAGWLRVEARAGAGVSWLAIRGQGFSNPQQHDEIVAVLSGGLRLASNGGRLRPWLEIGGAVWPVRAVAYQIPDGRETALPSFEAMFVVGLTVGS